jgi:hypothetical protein
MRRETVRDKHKSGECRGQNDLRKTSNWRCY